jgi:hypothetical protein
VEADRLPVQPGRSLRADHEQLNPGGRVVAIMSEGSFFGSDKRGSDFLAWLDRVGGVAEPPPAGSFLDSERSTGVKTRILIIDKPTETAASRSFD